MGAGVEDEVYPYVSVIVPAYNDADRILQLLTDLDGQDYPKARYEVLVVDNGSTDGTAAAVRGRRRDGPAAPVRLLFERGVQSSYAARNKALTEARGSILAFTDSDCRPAPGWLAAGVAALRGTGADQVAGRIGFTFGGDRPNAWEYLDATGHLDQATYAAEMSFGATANLFVRAEAIGRAGGFRPDLVSGGDLEFGRRMKRAGCSIAYCEDALVRHPARASRGAYMGKVYRVARGHEDLARLGLLSPAPLQRWELRPRRLPEPRGDVPRPAPLARIVGVLLHNYVHYTKLYLRLRCRRRCAAGAPGSGTALVARYGQR